MKRKIFCSMCLLALVTVLLSAMLLSIVFYQQLSKDMVREMNNGAAYLMAGIATEGRDYLLNIEGEDKDSRITLINGDGKVLFDSRVSVSEMENHSDRPEFAEAIRKGRGEAVRMSDTLGRQTYYLAVRLDDGTVLRLSSTTDSVLSALLSSIPLILAITAAVLFLALLLARFQTKRIVFPINTLDLENPMGNEIYDELSPLLSRIYQQRNHIEKQMIELQQKQKQFTAITGGMEEGLVVLDESGHILSVNQSALRLLGVENTGQIGKHILNLNRSLQINKVIEAALDGVFAEEAFALEHYMYQLRANPVFEDGKIIGAVLLILDMTETIKAEKIRQEFSANVSHELKTPLTTISGFAELLKNGMVNQEDILSFSEKIYEEARRLVILVEDIIQLSQLDEKKVSHSKEYVDLLNMAKDVKERIYPVAQQKDVSISVEGKSKIIFAVPQLIEELIYNLCDNAIKYNKKKGIVFIKVGEAEEMATLSVSDTGIGIPKEHQDRVFERFYRVDKSHSKDTGGTGLGLSIVKHIAAYHGGKISLESTMGKGTSITVSFPK
ncbi:MAG: ATP-binding protein [Eubacteriales bacterium]|nr:ATP-binding protein [Eubacteriales bacterium]MDD4583386.1 ATP-binding protein [Eubacteriales bacterium]